MTPLSPTARRLVLTVAIAGLLFDGFELGLMPVASLAVSESLLGHAYTKELGGSWFASFTASLMLGAAVGGIALGRLGDWLGRAKALGVSILFYSLFAGVGAWVETQEQMLVLRFFVGLGVGGVWPNAVALASECWPDKSRPQVAGLLGAALNLGILALSQVARVWPITVDSWRWIFGLAAVPAVLGVMVLWLLPESPAWLALKHKSLHKGRAGNEDKLPVERHSILYELFTPPLLRLMLVGILLGSIPLVGAWAASKWMLPWADSVSKLTHPGYKATVQGWWAVGAVLGSYFGAQIAAWLGRRRAYALISISATAFTLLMFLGTEPLAPSFLPIVFAQAFVSTLYFGWLPLFLPELFPTRVRATGSGIAFNTGRFATAVGMFAAGWLFLALNGSYPKVGAIGACVYAIGAIAILWAPKKTDSLD
jgi:MFS transporter, SHS family, sialic acid transporter